MTIDAKLRRASIIIAIGLLIQLLSLLPLHPLAFMAFVGIGVPVMAVGVVYYMVSLLIYSEGGEK